MPKSCFDGYLTPKCANCPDWRDGDVYGDGIGCYTSLPIMLCPYFKKMFEEEEKKKGGNDNGETSS